MTKPTNFIKNSDYKSVGNDDNKTVTLNIPDSFTIAVNGTADFYSDMTVGRINAPMITQISNSKGSGFIAPAACIAVVADHKTIPGIGDVGADYASAFIYRLNATTVRLRCVFNNIDGPGVPVTLSGAAQTITAKIKTFRDPFSN